MLHFKDVVKGNNNYEIQLFNEFNKFESPIKDSIQDYFKQLFYIGMYMRRWKGPGSKYPLSKSETTGAWEGPQKVVWPQLDILADLMAAVKVLSPEAGKFIEDLREVQHFDNQERVSHDESHILQHLLDITISGAYCIRMGSTFFIGTSAYYLKLFYNYKFDGYDIN